MRQLAVASAVMLLAVGVSHADDVKSGLQPGESAGFFNVRDVTGSFAGKTLCYR